MQNHLSNTNKEGLGIINNNYLFVFSYNFVMPSNVVLRNAKSRQAKARKKAVANKNRVAQKKRVVLRKKSISTKPKATRVRVTPAIRVAAGIVGILLGASVARGAGHPSPPPNQAVHANVKGTKVSAYTQQRYGPRGGFSSYRVAQRTTTNGPVVFVEQTLPNKGKSEHLELGIAQNLRLPGKSLLSLGLRTPEIGKGRIDWNKTDYGIILAKGGSSLQTQH